MVRPKAPKDKTYVDRSVPQNRFALGKNAKIGGFGTFNTLASMFQNHGSLLGFGAWTVLLCEVTGVTTVKPVKDLGTFVSGGLRGGENYRTISKARTPDALVESIRRAATGSSIKGKGKR